MLIPSSYLWSICHHSFLLWCYTIKVPNWKTPDYDGKYGFWFKKLTSIDDRLAIEINRSLKETDILEKMTKE